MNAPEHYRLREAEAKRLQTLAERDVLVAQISQTEAALFTMRINLDETERRLKKDTEAVATAQFVVDEVAKQREKEAVRPA